MSQWGLLVGVDAFPGPSNSHVFTDVQNPFLDSHAASIPGAQAAAEYDISWLINYGSFDIAADLQVDNAAGSSHIWAISTGRIYITTHSELTVTVDATYTFDLPTGMLATDFSNSIVDADTHEPLFHDTQTENTFGGQPVAGTFNVAAEVILPANGTFFIDYDMALDNYGSSGALATGSGHVNFTITPEPGTLALLALPMLAIMRRSRRASRADRAHRHRRDPA